MIGYKFRSAQAAAGYRRCRRNGNYCSKCYFINVLRQKSKNLQNRRIRNLPATSPACVTLGDVMARNLFNLRQAALSPLVCLASPPVVNGGNAPNVLC